MIRSADGGAAGELVRGVQPQTDDRDPGILKYGQNTRAYAHGILHGMLPVLPRLPEVTERRIAENDRRINAHAIRVKRGDRACRLDIARIVAAGKAGHHLQNQRETGVLHELCRLHGILAHMPAPAA